MSGERWREIAPQFPGYEVSDLGRVRSRRRGRLRILKPGKHSRGYMTVALYYDEKPKRCRSFLVHRLVLEAFVRPRRKKEQARHKNGNKTDNRLANLAWGTRAEQEKDRKRLGEGPIGTRNAKAKLTPAEVRTIRALSLSASRSALARRFGVSVPAICDVIKRKTWKHVQ